MNDLAAGRTRSASHDGMRKLRQPAQGSSSAMVGCNQRKGRGTGKSVALKEGARPKTRDAAARAVKTCVGKRKAPEPGRQQSAEPATLAGCRPQHGRSLERERGHAADSAKAARPRQVTVLGRPRVLGRRPIDSVLWDGETYSVCDGCQKHTQLAQQSRSRRVAVSECCSSLDMRFLLHCARCDLSRLATMPTS